jgi:hypothetical protein
MPKKKNSWIRLLQINLKDNTYKMATVACPTLSVSGGVSTGMLLVYDFLQRGAKRRKLI